MSSQPQTQNGFASVDVSSHSMGDLDRLPAEVRHKIYSEFFRGATSTVVVNGDPEKPTELTYTHLFDSSKSLLLVSRQMYLECKPFYSPRLRLEGARRSVDFFTWYRASEDSTSKAQIFYLDPDRSFMSLADMAYRGIGPPSIELLILIFDTGNNIRNKDENPELKSWDEWIAERRQATTSGRPEPSDSEVVSDLFLNDPLINRMLWENMPVHRDFDIKYEISYEAGGISKRMMIDAKTWKIDSVEVLS